MFNSKKLGKVFLINAIKKQLHSQCSCNIIQDRYVLFKSFSMLQNKVVVRGIWLTDLMDIEKDIAYTSLVDLII